ncbi:MAG: efflux RND transporter periplasmic adaptor subunit [Sandaracinaceae bacterium]
MDLDDADLRPPPIPVRVAPLRRRRTDTPLEVEGRFAASRAVQMKSPSSGLLQGSALALGDVVQKGQLLLTIGEAAARQRSVAAKAALHQAKGILAEREEALEAARSRDEKPERIRGFEAKKRAAESKVAQERAQQTRHELLLEALAVRAPFAGRVSAVHISVGSNVMSGNPLLELVDVDPIVLVLEVPTEAARRCEVGSEVPVRLGDTQRVGRISRWSPTAADDVRRLLVDVDNEDGLIAAGERGTAVLDIGPRDAFYAPRAALHHEKNTTHLQLVSHHKVLVRRVRTFGDDPVEVEVAGRPASSELVVLYAERPVKDQSVVVIRGDH